MVVIIKRKTKIFFILIFAVIAVMKVQFKNTIMKKEKGVVTISDKYKLLI